MHDRVAGKGKGLIPPGPESKKALQQKEHTMKLMKLAATALLCTSLMAGSAFAYEIEKPECIAPAKPGGGFDLTCRIAMLGLKSELPKLMQVTFMPGELVRLLSTCSIPPEPMIPMP